MDGLEPVLNPPGAAETRCRKLRHGGIADRKTPFIGQVHQRPTELTRLTALGRRSPHSFGEPAEANAHDCAAASGGLVGNKVLRCAAATKSAACLCRRLHRAQILNRRYSPPTPSPTLVRNSAIQRSSTSVDHSSVEQASRLSRAAITYDGPRDIGFAVGRRTLSQERKGAQPSEFKQHQFLRTAAARKVR